MCPIFYGSLPTGFEKYEKKLGSYEYGPIYVKDDPILGTFLWKDASNNFSDYTSSS